MHDANCTTWQKSSYSPNGNNCIELARARDGDAQLRESDDASIVLTTTPTRLRALLSLAKANRLD